MDTIERAITYEEPAITTILIVSGFLLALNAINFLLDKLVYCGLVGQIFVGVAFGTPGLQWLSESLESGVVQLGYLGLILLVYEGGLSTDTKLLMSNIWLSLGIAITGIATPIALSFVLQSMLDISNLQAFAAGAALCSTSLGTTFTILQTTDLAKSKLGVVLAGAAMMDDVVGLVLVQIIASLGSSPSISASTIARPIGVSLAFGVATPVLCYLAASAAVRTSLDGAKTLLVRATLPGKAVVFLCHTGILVAAVTSASYAGTSNLFAAYLAGASITSWDVSSTDQAQAVKDRSQTAAEISTPTVAQPVKPTSTTASTAAQGPADAHQVVHNPPSDSSAAIGRCRDQAHTGSLIYDHYYAHVVDVVLRPFFFASIGFSIPMANMFEGQIVWRGIIYSLLMLLAKLICGLWLVRFSMPSSSVVRIASKYMQSLLSTLRHKNKQSQPAKTTATAASGATRTPSKTRESAKKSSERRPQSLYPGALVGCAMVSRGEIGFLVSAVAQSSGLYTTSSGSELFLIVTWAIMLCTIIGPILTGLLTKRVWALQHDERRRQSGRADPLGIWGIS